MLDLSQLPRVGGYRSLWTPADVHAPAARVHGGGLVNAPESLLRWHALALEKFHKPAPWVSVVPMPATVNYNRWGFSCPHCNDFVVGHPIWPIACDFECGAVFTRVVYPSTWAAIEAVLMARPNIANRNWSIYEPLAQLEAENAAHGLPPKGVV